MEPVRGLTRLNAGQFFKLCSTFLTHPLYILPSWKATRKAMRICNDLYGDKHHYDNRTNAFRHALWNYLICKKSYNISDSVEKAVNWSKKITDLHEELFPNEELSRLMDLHNNCIGRQFFKKHPEKAEEYAVSTLQKEMLEAIRITTAEDLEKAGNKLVFLEKLKTTQ